MNSFWWIHLGGQNKGISLLSWDKLSIHKNDRGMCFKNLPTFNLDMLGKQGWWLMTNFDSLTSRLYKARYYPRYNFLSQFWDAKVGKQTEERGWGGYPSLVYRWIAIDVTLISHVDGDFPLVDLRVSEHAT
jgi:hypothetical protein